MINFFRVSWKILFEFNDYKPKKVNLCSVLDWVNQFPIPMRLNLFKLLGYVFYYSEKKTGSIISSLNKALLEKLKSDGVDITQVIYYSHDAGAGSSQVILNMLRDTDNLERRGANLVSDSRHLEETTNKIGRGAIIYVDDFIGTGTQFIENRNWIANFISGVFSEFVMAPIICEESISKLDELGISPIFEKIYCFTERPLHQNSNILKNEEKSKLIQICENIDPKFGLGYKNSAAMVVFYRNSVKNIPLVLRGNVKQNPYRGIFPRTDDLPY